MSVFSETCLAGGTYLVTGASSGLGRATALLIAQCGGKVVASGRDAERLASLLDSLPGFGHAISECSLRDVDSTGEWAKSLAAVHGPFSGVFHAAGIELIRAARLTKQSHVDDVLASSLFGALGIAKAMAQKGGMQDGGSLVIMSSVAGSSGQVGMAAYSAAKAGIDGMVRSLACEFAPKKIRVNSIAAGAVQTAMHDRLTKGGAAEVLVAYEQRHLLGFGEAVDIANAAVFLLGPSSRWVTGTTMVVDGGYLCK